MYSALISPMIKISLLYKIPNSLKNIVVRFFSLRGHNNKGWKMVAE